MCTSPEAASMFKRTREAVTGGNASIRLWPMARPRQRSATVCHPRSRCGTACNVLAVVEPFHRPRRDQRLRAWQTPLPNSHGAPPGTKTRRCPDLHPGLCRLHHDAAYVAPRGCSQSAGEGRLPIPLGARHRHRATARGGPGPGPA